MESSYKQPLNHVRMLYCADLHGNLNHYRRLLSLSVSEKADCIVLGGDLLPKGQPFSILVNIQKQFIVDHLQVLFEDFREHNPEKKIYLMMGNDDFAVNMCLFEEMDASGIAGTLHLRKHQLTDELSIAGYACVPPTSFMIKDWERLDGQRSAVPAGSYQAGRSTEAGVIPVDAREWFISHATMSEDLEVLAGLSDPAGTIYVMHSPPFWTSLDVLRNGRHAGSRSIRCFIEENTPPLTLHGHIHESHHMTNEVVDRIGNTICVNAGQSDSFFHAVIIDVPEYSIRRV